MLNRFCFCFFQVCWLGIVHGKKWEFAPTLTQEHFTFMELLFGFGPSGWFVGVE